MSTLDEEVRRARIVRDQALALATDAVRALEARARANDVEPGGTTVALRGRLEEVRGRALAVDVDQTGRLPAC